MNIMAWTNKQAGIRRERGIWGDSLGAISHVKLKVKVHQKGESSRIQLVAPVSLLVGFPDFGR